MIIMIIHINKRKMRVYWRQFTCYSFMLTLLGVHVIFQYAVVPNAVGLGTGSDWAPAETASGPDLALACEQWIGRRSLKMPKGFVGPEPDEDREVVVTQRTAQPLPPSTRVGAHRTNLEHWRKGGGEGRGHGPVPGPARGGRLMWRPGEAGEKVSSVGLVVVAQQRRLPFPRRLTNDDTSDEAPEVDTAPLGDANSHVPHAATGGDTFRPLPRQQTARGAAPGGVFNVPGGMSGGLGGYPPPPSFRLTRPENTNNDGGRLVEKAAQHNLNRKYFNNQQYAHSYSAPDEAAPAQYQQHGEGGFFVPAPSSSSTTHLWVERHHGNQETRVGLDHNGDVGGATEQVSKRPQTDRNGSPPDSHGVLPGSDGLLPGSPGTIHSSLDGLSNNQRVLTNDQALLPGSQGLLHGSQGNLNTRGQPNLLDSQGALPDSNNVLPADRKRSADSRLLYQNLPGTHGVIAGRQDILSGTHGVLRGNHRLLPDDRGVVPSIQTIHSNGVYRTRDDTTNPHHQRYQFTCANIQHITIKRKLGQGVTKQVYLGVHDNRKVAVKMVTRNVIDVLSCMKKLRRETADLSTLPGEKHKCYTLPNMKLMKEILLLNQLDHPNLLKLQGYCVRSEETDSTSLQEHGIVAVYEYGLRFYISNLREWPWQLRVRTAIELADLLEYLQQSPLGSLRISDFKDAHFLLKDGRIKLTDLDDVTSLEPTCQPNLGPELDLKGQRTPAKICGYGLKCVAGICPGYNAMKNLDNFHRLFFSNLLLGDTLETEEHMVRLRARLENLSVGASELKRILYHFMDVPFMPGYS